MAATRFWLRWREETRSWMSAGCPLSSRCMDCPEIRGPLDDGRVVVRGDKPDDAVLAELNLPDLRRRCDRAPITGAGVREVTLDQLGEFVAKHHTWDLFRLETLSFYNAASDADNLHRYLRGEPATARGLLPGQGLSHGGRPVRPLSAGRRPLRPHAGCLCCDSTSARRDGTGPPRATPGSDAGAGIPQPLRGNPRTTSAPQRGAIHPPLGVPPARDPGPAPNLGVRPSGVHLRCPVAAGG